jgi:formylglycine-generating enzyme required for sulfatase activity
VTEDVLRRALELFEAALDRPAQDREAFVRGAAAPDARLLQEVLSLLAHASDAPSDFVVPPPAPSASNTSAEGLVLGDFVLERELGRGAMGVVHLARQRSLDRPAAVKVLAIGLTTTEAQLERFHREAKAAAKLDHPHIARVLTDGTTDQLHWFAMEFVPGRTLAEELHLLQRSPHDPPPVPPPGLRPRSDPLHLTQIIGIVADAAAALAHAHRRGVIHRDVKPSNLLLTPHGTVKLVDFGVAHDEAFGSLTRSDQLLGTLPYMSPEQARVVEVEVDHRTDVYSLGVVLYELLTLRRPFAGATTHELIMHIRSDEPRPVSAINPRVPRDLAVICQHAMSKRLPERYESAAAFEDDLRRFLRHEAILARPPSLRVRAMRFAKKHRAAAVALLVALLALFAGVYLADRSARVRAENMRLARLGELEAQVFSGEQPASNGSLEQRKASLHEALLDLGRAGLAKVASGLDDDGGNRQVVSSIRLQQQLAELFPEKRYALANDVFEPRVSITVVDEHENRLRGRVGVRRLDPETAVAGPLEVLGPLPLDDHPTPSQHIRVVVEVEGLGLLEFTRFVRSGSELPLLGLVARPEQFSRDGMVLIKGARCMHPATLGTPLADKVVEVEDFWLDECEVSIGEYKTFLEAHRGIEKPPYFKLAHIADGSFDDRPVVEVSWEDARAYAEWRGKRLPNHAEWMLAARGGGVGRTWPWGESGPEVANASGSIFTSRAGALEGYFTFTTPVRSVPMACTPEGVYHLFGNVWEWTESHNSVRHPTGEVRPDYERRILCGSAWEARSREPKYDLSTIALFGTDWRSRDPSRGFRCARSAAFD